MTRLKSNLALAITAVTLATGFLAAAPSPAEARTYVCSWGGAYSGWVCWRRVVVVRRVVVIRYI